jgi:hypothetical protein
MIRGLFGLGLALFCLLPLGSGVLLITCTWDALTPFLRIGVGLFVGIASAIVLLPPLLYIGLSPSLPVVVLTGLAVLATGIAVRVRSPVSRERKVSFGALPGVALAVPLVLLAVQAVDKPVDRYDGFSNWVLKAKLLLGGGLFTGALNHDAFGVASAAPPVSRQYPIGLPAIYAYVLRSIGDANVRIGHLFFVVFLATFALTLWALLRAYVPGPILLAGLSYVLWMPALRVQSLSDYADVPMSCLLVAAIMAVGFWATGRHAGWLSLGAVFAAAALATKRDAIPFCVVVGAVAAAAVFRQPRRLAALGGAAVCVALTTVPWQLYVTTHGLTNRDVAFSLTRTADHFSAVTFVIHDLASVAKDPIYLSAVPLALLAAIIALRHEGERRLAAGFIVLSLGTVAALGFVYLNSIADLHYLLRTSGHRTFMTPALIAAAALPLLVSRALAPNGVQAKRSRSRSLRPARPN